MADYSNPQVLNPFQRYRQARKILRTTSRGKNPAWYRSALEMDIQIHLRTDGANFSSQLFNRQDGEWQNGPEFREDLCDNQEKAVEFATKLIQLAQGSGNRAVGVVFHNAEEFSIAEIRSDLVAAQGLHALKKIIEETPQEVLADGSKNEGEKSWRLIPYPSGKSVNGATAIQMSHRWSRFLETLREAGAAANFPVITHTVSSPLVSLLNLPEIKLDSPTKPILAVMPFPRFTVLAFFDLFGELILFRTLQRRGQSGAGILHQTVTSTIASLELEDPEIIVLPTDPSPDPRLFEELRFLANGGKMQIDTFSAIPDVEVRIAGTVPDEFRILTQIDKPMGSPLAEVQTFLMLGAEKWSAQDFLPQSVSIRELYPTKAEVSLLRASILARWIAVALTIGVLAFFAFDSIRIFDLPEWAYKPEDLPKLQAKQAQLASENATIQFWDSLLSDRSRAWSAMELLPRLFDNPKAMTVRSFSYTAAPGGSGRATSKSGFTKEWKILGFCTPEALGALTKERISDLFQGIAYSTGDQSFKIDIPGRELAVALKNQDNPGYETQGKMTSAPESGYNFPKSFELTITQKFSDADPLALPTGQAPK